MQVPLLDLKAQYATIRDEVRRAIDEVCDSQHFILGPQVEKLEKDVAAYSQCAHGIGVSSGTDALLVALMALDVKAGDEIVTTPYSFFATAGVIARLGAKPVFVDVDPRTYNINPALLERAITAKTRAIMPVHLFGQCADMNPILELAGKRNLPVIEDAAQAIGSEYKGKRAGSMGTLGCFSFFPSKNLGGFGDGGMVVTNDAALAERVRILRVHGSKPKYYHNFVGGNFRLDALQAAVLNVKLKHLDAWTAGRQRNAAFYNRALAGLPVERPAAVHHHIYNQYTIRTNKRDELQAFLKAANIGTEVYYPVPLHLQKCFADLGHKPGDFPQAEAAARESLALPIYPELSEDQLAYVTDTIREFFRHKA
jgi:dTDP-4-amino-4,6-dideoxygalactose transaminase